MNFFEEASLRLKQQLGCTQDKDLAVALGLAQTAWANRKKRDAFPIKEVFALAARRPELGLDAEWIVTGTSAYLTTKTKQETTLVQLFRLLGEQDRDVLLKSLHERTGFLQMSEEETKARWTAYDAWVNQMRATWQAPSSTM